MADCLPVVQGEAPGYAAAAVMPYNGEALESQPLHEFELLLGQGALRVSPVPGISERLLTVAVPLQVRAHDRKILGQQRSYYVPADMGLRITMQEQDGRTITSNNAVKGHPSNLLATYVEALKHSTRTPAVSKA
jgi:hypothetical protein